MQWHKPPIKQNWVLEKSMKKCHVRSTSPFRVPAPMEGGCRGGLLGSLGRFRSFLQGFFAVNEEFISKTTRNYWEWWICCWWNISNHIKWCEIWWVRIDELAALKMCKPGYIQTAGTLKTWSAASRKVSCQKWRLNHWKSLKMGGERVNRPIWFMKIIDVDTKKGCSSIT